ncbi:hypothetical protein CASFOL_024801 [Castilleja foliolosa]|uniref:C3H1-type domain-containing protein n=1 Tax=Castilleja foliolosa TaxID=1961234 RepID=A0ABD3CTC8_9LAMI
MKTSHANDTPAASPPTDFSCNRRSDNRRSDSLSVSIKPRFTERYYHSHPRVPLSVNRPKLSIPYKSELCTLFQRGKCFYGQNCHFAHSLSEINNPMFKTVAMKELHLDVKEDNKFNTNECSYFSRGRDCPRFLQNFDRNVKRDVNRGSLGINDGDYRSPFYKTRICRMWEVSGVCPFGVKCSYAHGYAELQRSGFTSRPKDVSSSDVESKVAKKLRLKGRSYFTNWDTEKISRIYADY